MPLPPGGDGLIWSFIAALVLLACHPILGILGGIFFLFVFGKFASQFNAPQTTNYTAQEQYDVKEYEAPHN